MAKTIEVFLFGSLLKKFGDQRLELELKGPTQLPEILRTLGIPSEQVQLSMVNYRAVSKDSTIQPGDRVSLFPIEYPVFTDWKDFRF